MCICAWAYSAALAGLVISIQYIALSSAAPGPATSATAWAPRSRSLGMGALLSSGALLMVAAAPARVSLLSFAFLILSAWSWGGARASIKADQLYGGISSAGRPAPPKSSPSTASAPMAPWRWGSAGRALDSLWGTRSGAWLQLACSPCSLAPSASPWLPQESRPCNSRRRIFPSATTGPRGPHGMAWRWGGVSLQRSWPLSSLSFT